MRVWGFNRRILALFCVILLVFLLVTFTLTDNDGRVEFTSDFGKQNTLEATQTAIGNPHGARTLKQSANSVSSPTTCEPKNLVMDVAAVICGDREEEAMNMVKSILIFTDHRVHFHIVAEQNLQQGIKKQFETFPSSVRENLEFTVYNISYPPGEDAKKWMNLFKPCASQRLFLPNFIKRDKLLYLDTDTLVLSPLQELWHHLNKFNRTHLAALAPEGEVAVLNWYHRFARHPFYGQLGLNSGVMLMDLKKLRELKFTKKIIEIYREYKQNIVWGDQDLLNIYFNKYPDKVYVYPCEWNYRPDHCMYQNNCPSLEQNGVYVLHGNRGVFHNDKHRSFKAVYDIIKDYKFGQSIKEEIVSKILKAEKQVSDPYCEVIMKHFVKNMVQPVR